MNKKLNCSVNFNDKLFDLCNTILMLERELMVNHQNSIGFSLGSDDFELVYREIDEVTNSLVYYNQIEDHFYGISIKQNKVGYTLYEYDLVFSNKPIICNEELIYFANIYNELANYYVRLNKIKHSVLDDEKSLYGNTLMKKRGNYEQRS